MRPPRVTTHQYGLAQLRPDSQLAQGLELDIPRFSTTVTDKLVKSSPKRVFLTGRRAILEVLRSSLWRKPGGQPPR
ncbi:hypothetical protein VTN77DRAFT_2037 [Rasamsonia byssochlamydoides]|uniref:uncharacterized protein n=1 Tax=Rasamsonia byssochlamydoides TaxID=89139 RepID=UPI00374310EE